MKRMGYRNCDENHDINSDIEHFNFNKNDIHLKIDCFKEIKSSLASIERVNFYLEDRTLIKNLFIFSSEFVYYFEKEWYYDGDDPRSKVLSPKMSIFERFCFKKEDVVLIKADNNPISANFDFGFWFRIDWLFGVKPNRLDTKKSIEKNIFVKERHWKILPKYSEDDLFRNLC